MKKKHVELHEYSVWLFDCNPTINNQHNNKNNNNNNNDKKKCEP